jgi:hypothetical protein
MSDAYFQARARRRTRLLAIAAAIVVVILLVLFGIWTLFHDTCTGSFERSPTAVVSAYLDAVSRGNVPGAQGCWEHEAFYALEAGCSEICLSKVYGAQFQVAELTTGEPYTTPNGRANLQATVSIACTEGGQTHTAEILLDSVSSDLPWRHWAIIHSTLGGSVADPWCK